MSPALRPRSGLGGWASAVPCGVPFSGSDPRGADRHSKDGKNVRQAPPPPASAPGSADSTRGFNPATPAGVPEPPGGIGLKPRVESSEPGGRSPPAQAAPLLLRGAGAQVDRLQRPQVVTLAGAVAGQRQPQQALRPRQALPRLDQ